MSCSDFQEFECKQCELLLRENKIIKNLREILRLKIGKMSEEMQKLEEQLQEEVNFSNSMAELLKQTGE